MLEGAAVSQTLMDDLASAAHDYTSLTVQTSLNPFASDHVPFINAGAACLLTIEGADASNHNIHTANDTLDKVNLELASEILKMNIAVVAQRLGVAASAGERRVQSTSPIAAWGANRLDAFVLGTDRALYHKWWDGNAWGPSVTDYEYMGAFDQCSAGGGLGPEPARCLRNRNGQCLVPQMVGRQCLGPVGDRLGVYGRGLPWRSAHCLLGSNRLDAFVLGTDRALYHKWSDGNAWGPSVTDYEYMGGVCIGQPEIVAAKSAMSSSSAPTGHFITSGSMATARARRLRTTNGSAACACQRPGRWPGDRTGRCFVIGTDSALYHKWWDGANWGPSVDGFEYMGGVCVGQPEIVAWGPNRLDVFVIGTDSALYHKWWDGANWGPSGTGYEYTGRGVHVATESDGLVARTGSTSSSPEPTAPSTTNGGRL